MFRFLLTAGFIALPLSAWAHPHKTDETDVEVVIIEDDVIEAEELTEKLEEKLAKHRVVIAKSMAKAKRKFDEGASADDGEIYEDIDAVADALEEVFSDKGLFRDLTAMVHDFAEDVDVDSHNGVTVLKFDGATIGKIAKSKSRDSEDRLSISGLGQNLTLDRETVIENGKSKTRIVIEMDGGDEIDITLPNP